MRIRKRFLDRAINGDLGSGTDIDQRFALEVDLKSRSAGETAAKLLQRAYEIQPNAEIGAHLGEVLWKSGDQTQALDAWRRARKLEPDNDTLVKTLERFQVNANNL